jgi:hypothetical protein
MRRKDSRIVEQEAVKVQEEGLYGNLATVGEDEKCEGGVK